MPMEWSNSGRNFYTSNSESFQVQGSNSVGKHYTRYQNGCGHKESLNQKDWHSWFPSNSSQMDSVDEGLDQCTCHSHCNMETSKSCLFVLLWHLLCYIQLWKTVAVYHKCTLPVITGNQLGKDETLNELISEPHLHYGMDLQHIK